MESIWSDILNEVIRCDASIVDNDVDLKLPGFGMGEVVFDCGDEVCSAVRRAYVCLDGEGCDTMLRLEFRG